MIQKLKISIKFAVISADLLKNYYKKIQWYKNRNYEVSIEWFQKSKLDIQTLSFKRFN